MQADCLVTCTLGLAGDPAAVYAEGDPTCRRPLVFAFFRKILVHELAATVPPPERRVLEVGFMEPYDRFYNPEVIEAAEQWADQHLPATGQIQHGPGSTVASVNLCPLGSRKYRSSNLAPRASNLRMRWSDEDLERGSTCQDGLRRDARGEVVVQDVQPRTLLSPGHEDRLLAEFEAGESIRGLARKHKLHRSTVIRSLRKSGVPPQQPMWSVTKQPEMVRQAHRLRLEGLTVRKIATVMGVSHPTVVRLLKV